MTQTCTLDTGMTTLSFALLLSMLSSSPSKPVILWIDGHANFGALSTQSAITAMLDTAKSAGVTDIVIDVKPIDGYALYPSSLAPQLTHWQGEERNPAFPYVETLILEARSRGMKAYLAFNVFAEGHKIRKLGRVYEDSTLRERVMVSFTPEGFRSMMDTPGGVAVFVNPARSDVRSSALAFIEELCRRFEPDGIVLDRCRYADISTDFSAVSREQFEQYIGKNVNRWPEDILSWKADGKEYNRGPLFREWLEWRASVIRSFVEEARRVIKKIDPNMALAIYAGAWYPEYFELGVNWASQTYDASAEYDWATKGYSKTGYAELLDFLMTGNYFYEVKIEELRDTTVPKTKLTEPSMKLTKGYWNSVEGSAHMAKKVTKGVIPVLGSLYVDQYKANENPTQFEKAIRLLLKETDGIMIFDLVHLRKYGWWEHFRRAVEDSVY